MARFGARIRNRSTGSNQIDDLYANMALIAKATQSAGSSGYTGVVSTSWTYVSTEMPILAFACARPTWVNYVARNEGANSWTFTISTHIVGSPVNITCYQFGTPPVLGPGWGMRIKRAGVVKYDSRHRYARVEASLRGSLNVQEGPWPSTTLGAGKTYAVLAGNTPSWALQSIQIQGGTQQGYIDTRYAFAWGVAISGGSIVSDRVQTYFNSTFLPVPPSPPPPAFGYDIRSPQYSWAILDVTGY